MEQRQKLEAVGRKILQETRTELLLSMHFLGPSLGSLQDLMDLSTTTVGTDAAYVRFNPSFLMQTFLEHPRRLNRTMVHMLLHCLFRHMFYERSFPDRELYHLCCDICVESVLDSMVSRRLVSISTSSGKSPTTTGSAALRRSFTQTTTASGQRSILRRTSLRIRTHRRKTEIPIRTRIRRIRIKRNSRTDPAPGRRSPTRIPGRTTRGACRRSSPRSGRRPRMRPGACQGFCPSTSPNTRITGRFFGSSGLSGRSRGLIRIRLIRCSIT